MTARWRAAAAASAIAAVAAAGGCAAVQRLAPPGLVKYEDIAGDHPPHPIIAERIAAREVRSGQRFPNLSEAPNERPTTLTPADRALALQRLERERDALLAAVEGDRAVAAADRANGVMMPGRGRRDPVSIEEAADSLSEAVRKDREASQRDRARERATPPLRPAEE